MEPAAAAGTLEAAPADGDATGLVRTLTATVFLQWLGASAIIPMLPVYVRQLGGSDVDAGVVMASFFAAEVLLQYPTGRLADRIGRRPVLIAGLLLFGAASVGFLAPITPADAVVLRALQGAGAGAASVASLAMISGSVALERRGRAFAAVYGGEIAGLAIGPSGRKHHRRLARCGSSSSARPCSRSWRRSRRCASPTPTDGMVGRRGRPGRERRDRLVVGRAAAGALLAGSSLGLTTGVYEICWTLLLVSKGASGLEIGISWTLFAVPFVAVSKPSGWLADHVDRRALVVGGIGSSAALCAVVPVHPRACPCWSSSARPRRWASPRPFRRCSRCSPRARTPPRSVASKGSSPPARPRARRSPQRPAGAAFAGSHLAALRDGGGRSSALSCRSTGWCGGRSVGHVR